MVPCLQPTQQKLDQRDYASVGGNSGLPGYPSNFVWENAI
jgi:hypothetical protein